jgi:hypothetical protein
VTSPRAGALALACALSAVVAAGAASLPVPGTERTVDVGGWVDGLAVAELGGPRQRPQAIGEVRFLHKASRALRFHLTLRGRAGGPFEGGHPGVMNFVHEFQNRTPSLEVNEAFAELRTGAVELRAGIQKFAWGRLDGVPPTDVLGPRDLHDPIVRDVEESKIGIPALQGTWFLPPAPALDLSELRASLTWIPIAVPTRLALRAERWFPPSVDAARMLRFGPGEVESLFGLPDTSLRVPVTLRTLNHRAPYTLGSGGLGARLGGRASGVDWDLYHYTGPETGPNADLRVSVALRSADTGGPVTRLVVPADSRLRQEHDTIHMTGADGAATFGGLTVRGEVAWFVDRPYLRITSDLFSPAGLAAIPPATRARIVSRVLAGRRARVPLEELFPDRDSIEWGLGADYLVAGFLPLVQVNQTLFVDGGPEQLLADPETRILGSVRKRLLADTLELELRAVYAVEREAWFVFPRATYRWGDHWRFRLGYLAVGGPLESNIGQFDENDQFVLEGRYGF